MHINTWRAGLWIYHTWISA